MKNLFKSLMLVAVAAMTFTACQNDNGEMDMLVKKTVIEFTAGFDADTRSHFGDKVGDSYPSFWEGGEQVAFVAPAADYDGTYTAYAEAVKLDDEGKSATFTVEFDNPIKAGTVKAYLGTGWNTLEDYAYIPWSQTPRASSVDAEAFMASASFEYDGVNMNVNGSFKHGVAYGKMTVNGFDGKNISEVAISLLDKDAEYPNQYTLYTEELDEHTYWFATEACEAQEFTVSVVVDGVSYSKSVTLTADKPLNFNVGRVSTFSVSNLAKDPVQLDTPIIDASFADGKVTATWDAIENAVAYTVEVNGEVVEEAYKATTYTFDAQYNTQYEIAVTAKAAEGSADYLDSYKGNTNFTTPMDISMETDYVVTLKSYTVNGSTYRFTGEAANDWLSIPFHTLLEGELPAGSYTGVYGNWSFSATAALEYDWYNVSCNLAEKPADSLYWNNSAGLVVVERENNSFKVTAIVSIYIDGYSKTVKYVYEESYSEPVTLDGKITKWTHTDTNWPTKYLVEGNGFSFYVGMYRNRENYLDTRDGGYSLGNSSSLARCFSIHDISIPSLGDNLNVTAGTLNVNEGGTAGAIHDIDITLTINGSEYEFTYYGYINGEAVEGGGGSEPEPEPELPANIALTTWNEGDYYPGNYRSSYIVSGDNISMKVWINTDYGANATSLGQTHNYTWIEVSNVGNLNRFSTQNIIINGVEKSANGSSTMSVVNNGDNTFNVTMNLVFTDGTSTTVTYTGAVGTTTEPENPGEGGGEEPETPGEGGETTEPESIGTLKFVKDLSGEYGSGYSAFCYYEYTFEDDVIGFYIYNAESDRSSLYNGVFSQASSLNGFARNPSSAIHIDKYWIDGVSVGGVQSSSTITVQELGKKIDFVINYNSNGTILTKNYSFVGTITQ